jgi:hypothetical protein
MPAAKSVKTTTRAKTAKTAKRSRSTSNVTLDHNEIRRWAEERQGEPACVRGTGSRGDIGMLRIDFPSAGRAASQQKLQKISWDEWFSKFDERGLAFLHQDQTATGRTSRFNKLVNREGAGVSKQKSEKNRTAARNAHG